MSPDRIQAKVVSAKAGWVRRMLEGIGTLPLGDPAAFLADPRNQASAESYLRRALEALLDLGRHILAKGFGRGPGEYRLIALELAAAGVLRPETGQVMVKLAGYRNRMVHLYNEVDAGELHAICRDRLGDVEAVLAEMLAWVESHPDRVDEAL